MLGTELTDQIAGIRTSRRPVWLLVSQEDFTTSVAEDAADKVALLLDPEIGIICYVIHHANPTSLREQVSRALYLRSQLSIESHYTGSFDERSDGRGSWRIALLWLVDENLIENWNEQMVEMRHKTGFSEEISMDAVFILAGAAEEAIKKHAFPRLLLTTRDILRKSNIEEVIQWMSANQLVDQAINAFPQNFTNSDQKAFAKAILRSMEEYKASPARVQVAEAPPSSPRELKRIRIKNFRNLRDVRFDLGNNAVSAAVIHGPNGTGKSSICEAISIALFGSSFRFKWFSDRVLEKDVTATDRGQEYLSKYLTPLGEFAGAPQIAIDDREFEAPKLVLGSETEKLDLEMNGTILTQDSSLEFARMPSSQLGARILRGYSDLADHVEQFAESQSAQANKVRQDFLRGLNLSASITRPDTVYDKIVRREFDTTLPSVPTSVLSWLDSLKSIPASTSGDLASGWRTWGTANREQIIKDFSKRGITESASEAAIYHWLTDYNDLVARTNELKVVISRRTAAVMEDFDEDMAKLSAWGEWLQKRGEAPYQAVPVEAVALTVRLGNLEAEHRKIVERGSAERAHLDHLTSIEAFVRETWSRQHPDECPTCGVDHSSHGGIVSVLEEMVARSNAAREALKENYNRSKAEIQEVQRLLASSGSPTPPISDLDQARFLEAFDWLVPESLTLNIWIAAQQSREELIGLLLSLRKTPSIPLDPLDASEIARRTILHISEKFSEATAIFEAPANWKPVIENLTQTLSGIVTAHLPHTLEQLWRELALNLTSAPWVLPDPFRISISNRRGAQSSSIRVSDRLARFILNQAEVHTLGLGWFFTRYLTRGRFYDAVLVMDDAAHELDQTSFRELCRLWETLLRLHRVYDLPLKLVVLLNQESRAIEAARATGGLLSILSWNREQDTMISSVDVVGEGFYPPEPEQVFAKTGT